MSYCSLPWEDVLHVCSSISTFFSSQFSSFALVHNSTFVISFGQNIFLTLLGRFFTIKTCIFLTSILPSFHVSQTSPDDVFTPNTCKFTHSTRNGFPIRRNVPFEVKYSSQTTVCQVNTPSGRGERKPGPQCQPNLAKGAPGVECRVAESKINNISELPLTSGVMDSEAVKTRALCAKLLPRVQANIILKGIFSRAPAQLPTSPRWVAVPFRPPFGGSKSIGREAKSRHAPCPSCRGIPIATHHFCVNPIDTHVHRVSSQSFPKSIPNQFVRVTFIHEYKRSPSRKRNFAAIVEVILMTML